MKEIDKLPQKFENRLPEYFLHDIRALDEGIDGKVLHIDCLLDEIQGSINMLYYDHYITWDEAGELRDIYL